MVFTRISQNFQYFFQTGVDLICEPTPLTYKSAVIRVQSFYQIWNSMYRRKLFSFPQIFQAWNFLQIFLHSNCSTEFSRLLIWSCAFVKNFIVRFFSLSWLVEGFFGMCFDEFKIKLFNCNFLKGRCIFRFGGPFMGEIKKKLPLCHYLDEI